MMIRRREYLKWLYPGLGVKRWLLVILLGLGVIILGIWTVINNQHTRDMAVALVNWLEVALPSLTFYQGIACFVAGILLIIVGIHAFIKQYLSASSKTMSSHAYYRFKTLQRGPRIVVIGGGTGLSVLLRGLKEYSSNLTAVVSVGDDGGSSGRLREQYNVVPVGDIRNCIVAMADEEDVMEKLFNYRFNQGAELDGHNLGNLLLLAMSNLMGSFQDAVAGIDQILHIRGKVLPVAVEPMTLKAELIDGTEIIGESNIAEAWLPIERLKICPERVEALTEVLAAIDQADAVILGPGSLYTSIIPNLLVDGVVDHLCASGAMKFYICNVMTQAGETEHYSAEDHLRSLLAHSAPEIVDYMVINDQATLSQEELARYEAEGASPVRYDLDELEQMGVKVIQAHLLSADTRLHHDAQGLAQAVMHTIYSDKGFRSKRGWLRSFWDRQKLKAE